MIITHTSVMPVVASEGQGAKQTGRGNGEVSRLEEAPARHAIGGEAVRSEDRAVVLL